MLPRQISTCFRPIWEEAGSRPPYLLHLLFIWLCVLVWIRATSRKDPTSWHFDADTAYELRYSALRQEQGDAFLRDSLRHSWRFEPKSGDVTLCLGIPSFTRQKHQYLPSTVATLLAGLRQDERARVFLMPFITHADPRAHPSFSEPWLSATADRVLTYSHNDTQFPQIEKWESKLMFREKALFDYAHLLDKCLSVQTDYVAIVEDDVIAMDGWFHRTMRALSLMTSRADYDSALYLRMFHTEEFFGWQSQNWPRYVIFSLCLDGLICAGLVLLKRLAAFRRHLSPLFIFSVATIHIPLWIALGFSAGTHPFLSFWYPPDLALMNSNGCCAQGLVFPFARALEMRDHYLASGVGFVDMLTERYADEHGYQRFAVMPSVLQHVGSATSKTGVDEDPFPAPGEHRIRSIAEKMWNFRFETFQVEELKHEYRDQMP